MSNPNPPAQTGSPERLLPCGRDPVEVVDRARAGRSSTHEQSCPHCQAAIEADGVARTATREFAEAERAYPVPTTMLPNIMRSVWSDLRRSTMIPLTTDAGSAFVADHTIAAVIEYALNKLTDLQIHTSAAHLIAADPDPGTATAGTIAIEVAAGVAYNADARAVATQARDIVRHIVAEQFGWTAEPIDIAIVDVFLPESSEK